MSLKGSIGSLSQFAKDLQRLPRVVAQRVTEAAAAPLTTLARSTFSSSEDAYGGAWAPGANGQTVTLRASGTLMQRLVYVAIGTKLRVSMAVPYAKYQIGKRPVFPRQGLQLPEEYSRTLARLTVAVVRAELGR